MKDFIAIDFETANECASSVCSIGAVLVRDGEIVKTFYSLIRPEPDYYKWFCQQVHGLGHEDTDDAEVFPFVWRRMTENCWKAFRSFPRIRRTALMHFR